MSLCGGCLASDRNLKPVRTAIYLLQFLNTTRKKGQPKNVSTEYVFTYLLYMYIYLKHYILSFNLGL